MFLVKKDNNGQNNKNNFNKNNTKNHFNVVVQVRHKFLDDLHSSFQTAAKMAPAVYSVSLTSMSRSFQYWLFSA